jgi:hypothetical protein
VSRSLICRVKILPLKEVAQKVGGELRDDEKLVVGLFRKETGPRAGIRLRSHWKMWPPFQKVTTASRATAAMKAAHWSLRWSLCSAARMYAGGLQ